MPPPARPSAPQPQPQELPVPSYPAVETFIEKASASDVQALFAPVKQGLADLKGPRAEIGKKAQAAIARSEELLGMLVDVREKLVAESKQSKGRK
ncbi:hypothetical protein D7Y15_20570 [Corallococcus sp. AB030]|uniref:Uncharacterized protein n=4 Tax=Myxococcaceae TaxID=31 RepID=A0A7X4YD62_9BACT|nr:MULTISPECIES: hypothetical protein [Corallococcus]MBN8466552.1 hypothetical protein [Corallococcus exiguus]NBC43000.1 hypothetical protein [Corallococcus exiguus]NRD55922.1 hypothetical protein [Corallococcus exiguus]RKI11255.1 hypothetical protein D7Y15_20570 [Corallococcus sp. AB030]